MAKKEQLFEMSELSIRQMVGNGRLKTELDFERAVLAERFLQLLIEDQPELEPLRKEVRSMIMDYESIQWSKDVVSEAQIAESDLAEAQADTEFRFFISRRELILSKLKSHDLRQNDLANILAHSKSYTSELLNGIRAFSTKDLIVVHKLLDIKLEDLFFTEIPLEVKERIKSTLDKIPERKNKLQPQTLEMAPK
jgi:antitoxin component HigA of HigAB toxin-antitoxin module